MGAGHGIGIKRNDYHRRNRRRNISMHSHSHGRNVQTESVEDKIDRLLDRMKLPTYRSEELIEKARRHLARDGRETSGNEFRIERICVNWLRHCHTPYDAIIRKQPSHELFVRVANRIFTAIGYAYPWLSVECEQQLRLKTNFGKIRIVKHSERVLLDSFCVGPRLTIQFADTSGNEDDAIDLNGALTSLASSRLLYQPPFLKPEEIKARRFTNQYGEMNDRWWEWEEEKGLQVPDREPRFRWTY